MLKNSISNFHNLIYIHIPKTGGNSIKHSLGHFDGDSHFKLNDFDSSYSDFRFAAFVRNPWDRVFSAYYYLLHNGSGNNLDLNNKKQYIDPYNSFESFILHGLKEASLQCIHFVPQIEFLKSKNHKMSFIGKLEHMISDFYLMCHCLQLKPSDHICKINQSFKPDYRNYFTHEMKVRLYNTYMDDCNILGYRFDEATVINSGLAYV